MENKGKTALVATIVGVIAVGILASYVFSEFFSIRGNAIKKIYIKSILVRAEVVSSLEKIEQGLAGRRSLGEGRGMLFSMPGSDTQKFWMKGMRFPIDIIWIENGRVIGCEENISPEDNRIFTSPGPAGSVLEVPAGFCGQYRIETNDLVEI